VRLKAIVNEFFRARRHRITIQQKIERRNAVGEFLFDWQDVCTTWSEIKDNTITIRYQPELWPGMRVVIGNSYFEIVGVIDRQGKTRLVELQVKEIRASAVLPDARWRWTATAEGFRQSGTNTGD
jgi:head-tail adaptor